MLARHSLSSLSAEPDVRSILDLNFEYVPPGHGDPMINNAKEKYRTALKGDLKEPFSK